MAITSSASDSTAQELQRSIDVNDAVDRFALTLQSLAHERIVWFTIVNELARTVPSDRVAVLSAAGWRMQAISHMDTLDRRSPVVRSIERLAAVAAGGGEAEWLQTTTDAESSSAAPQWQRYLEESSARSAALIPLLQPADAESHGPPSAIGAVLIERLRESPFSSSEQHQIERLCRHAAAAVSRVIAQQRKSLFARVRRISMAIGLLMVAGILGAAFMPIDFTITARGELQPTARQHVFAPMDGLVRELHVREGQTVASGEALLQLTNDELELELTRVRGELQTARQQLVTIQAARLDPSVTAPLRDQRDQRGQLVAEEERLKQVAHSLEAQIQLLLQRQDQLTVRSPIAGRILTANTEQLLRSRPLRRGQQLLTVADENQAWMLELRIEDQDVGHVMAARQLQANLPLQFVLATEPSQVHSATVERIAEWTDFDESGRAGVRVTARVVNSTGIPFRTGATVTGKIDCGRKPLGYVWLRDLIEMIRMRVFFLS